jgi:histidine ammonia-lyase
MKEPIVLNGKGVTLNAVMEVARQGRKVAIAPDAMQNLHKARELIFDLMDEGVPMYGCNTGVGWNKDIPITRESTTRFNSNLLHSHAVGITPYATEEETRAALLIRLNTLLTGHTGISPHIPVMYAEFLNRGIHPLIPERGSVGEADIGLLAHVGLAMTGEGHVLYKGNRVPSQNALKAENLAPVELGAKDGLAIVSSNALGSGQAAVTLCDALTLICASEIIYCLSLEAFGGNISPLNAKSHEAHGFQSSIRSAARMRDYLSGSYLYERGNGKSLQDPLCFRNGAHLYGTACQTLENAEKMLTVHFNHSDDNPCLILEDRAVVSCSNFDPLPWVLELETVALALSHISKAACLRSVKLATPTFSGLSRNLTPDNAVIAFSTIQKTFASLDAEIRLLAHPVSMDTFSLAGDMEDLSTNAPMAAQKLRKIVDNLFYIVGIEWILAGQALDLRKGVTLGKETVTAFSLLRKAVPFYSRDDHAITDDIYAAYHLLKSGVLSRNAQKNMENQE